MTLSRASARRCCLGGAEVGETDFNCHSYQSDFVSVFEVGETTSQVLEVKRSSMKRLSAKSVLVRKENLVLVPERPVQR